MRHVVDTNVTGTIAQLVRMISRYGRHRHGGIVGRFGLLDEGFAAAFFDEPQAVGAVRVAAAENDADDPKAIDFCGGDEPRIGCGTRRDALFSFT